MQNFKHPSPSYTKESINPRTFYEVELGITPKSNGIGWYVGGLCPFHNDTKQGSFRVHLGNGAFTCFACGTKGGDILAFTQLRYSLNFPETIRKLIKDWGI